MLSIDNLVIIIGIIIILMYHVIETTQRGGKPVIFRTQDFIDKQCSYLIKRGQTTIVNPDCLMFEPMLRPCGLNAIFFQNCRGEFLVVDAPGKPLIWKAFKDITNPKTACFLIVNPLNPIYLDIPGFVSIVSMAIPGHYLKLEKGIVILSPDPRYTNECRLCEFPLFKEYSFKIKKGFARFDKAFCILDFLGNYLTINSGMLQRNKLQLTSVNDKINATFYFGPNIHILPA